MKVAKKFLSLLMVLTMVACMTACGGAGANKKTAEGTAKGMGGDVKVTVTVENGKITSVVAKGDNETPGIGLPIIEDMPKLMVENNTINIDSVSGATITSEAVKEAAKQAIEKMGLNVADFSKEVAKSTEAAKNETYDVDVAVVGAGGAGLSAAITVHDNGKKVIILESQSMVGGNTIRSTGGLNATKTVYQDKNKFTEEAGLLKTLDSAKKKYADNKTIMGLVETVEKQYEEYKKNPSGYFDSVELMELDTMVGGTGKNDFSLVKVLCEGSANAIDWLKGIGASLDNVGAFGGASVKRIHRPVNAEGKTVSVGSYLVPLFEKAVNQRGINIVFNTRADKLLMNGGKVVGVHAVKNDGSEVVVNAKNVILATGGFGANLDMVVKYDSKLNGFMTTNAPGAQGDGILMAQEVGADVVDLDKIQIHPTVEANTAALIT
ncbi:MAG: FAD-dependent oxidoreductase, partial [Lachnospiraceae bacterium]|nr:FAD-dependent oxidoreductase [Lachnospiraceae bacterium]